MVACQNGHEDVAQLFISSSDIDLNARDKEGSTAFMFACYHGLKDLVQLFLSKDNELNMQNSDGHTAIMGACQNGHKVVVQLLLDSSEIHLNIRDRWKYCI